MSDPVSETNGQQRVVMRDYCKQCGGFIEWNTNTVLLSSPIRYRGECKDCGCVYFEECTIIDAGA